MTDKLIGYQEGEGFLYRLSGSTKMLFFILVSVAAMATYDTRLILAVALLSLGLLKLARIKWSEISFVLVLVVVVALFNLVMVYLFSPSYGTELYGRETVLLKGWGRFNLTSQELFYLLNLALKYFCTVPLALVFLMTTHPSQFAASLNRLGLPYKLAYSVSLTLRYIPDVQEEFLTIKRSQEARGLELSQKASLLTRIKGNLQIVTPLILGSLERIDTVTTAMELRRFGKLKKRTWYRSQPFGLPDYLAILVALAIVVAALSLFFLNQGRFYNPWKS